MAPCGPAWEGEKTPGHGRDLRDRIPCPGNSRGQALERERDGAERERDGAGGVQRVWLGTRSGSPEFCPLEPRAGSGEAKHKPLERVQAAGFGDLDLPQEVFMEAPPSAPGVGRRAAQSRWQRFSGASPVLSEVFFNSLSLNPEGSSHSGASGRGCAPGSKPWPPRVPCATSHGWHHRGSQ